MMETYGNAQQSSETWDYVSKDPIFYLLWDEQKYICEQTRNEPRNPGQRPQKKNFRLPGDGSGSGSGAWSFAPETGLRNRKAGTLEPRNLNALTL